MVSVTFYNLFHSLLFEWLLRRARSFLLISAATVLMPLSFTSTNLQLLSPSLMYNLTILPIYVNSLLLRYNHTPPTLPTLFFQYCAIYGMILFLLCAIA